MEVERVERLSARLVQVTLRGEELAGFTIEQPASSVRLLLPHDESGTLEMPRWTGNEFLLASGQRPAIRTLTPRRLGRGGLELDVEIVVHGKGVASAWAEDVYPGAAAAVSGPGRGYLLEEARDFVLIGDESAISAIGQLIEALPHGCDVEVHVEIADPGARTALPSHPHMTVDWHVLAPSSPPGQRLVEVVENARLNDGAKLWAAGEAAAMQRIRRNLFEVRSWPRDDASVRGYWKFGRSGDDGAI